MEEIKDLKQQLRIAKLDREYYKKKMEYEEYSINLFQKEIKELKDKKIP